MVVITKQEIEEMKNHIIDEETGMSELDLFEFNHAYEGWKVLN